MKKLFTLLALAFCLNGKAQIITTVAGSGVGSGAAGYGGYNGDGGQATLAELAYPVDIAIDINGNLYIADQLNAVIRKVEANTGIITTIAGNHLAGYSGDGGVATAAELSSPRSVAIDVNGNVYITDYYRIRKVSASTGIIVTIAGTGSPGYSGDNGAATAAQLNPQGIAVDAGGNVYVADYYDDVIRRVDASTGIITTVAGNGYNAGYGGGYSGDNGAATAAELDYSTDVTLDAAGNLYIADKNNFRIRKVTASTGIITTIAGNGTPGYNGNNGAATAAELDGPYSVAVDVDGNVYIADNSKNTIRKVDASTGTIIIIAGIYTQGYNGDNIAATSAELYNPNGIAIDTAGNLYIADTYNQRIRKINNVIAAGIEQIKENNAQLNIYPNPNNGIFIIETNLTSKQTLQVYDVNGKLVLSQTINGENSIDLSNINAGVYNISLLSSDGVVNKKLAIVK